MYQIFEAVINRGGYKLDDMLSKINIYTVEGKLTNENRTRLEQLAREKASAQAEVDMLKLLLEHESRIRALEAKDEVVEEDSNPDEEENVVELYAEYVPGTVTIAGDKWSWKGKNYVVITADAAHPCIWSPDDYPTYWKLEEVQPE